MRGFARAYADDRPRSAGWVKRSAARPVIIGRSETHYLLSEGDCFMRRLRLFGRLLRRVHDARCIGGRCVARLVWRARRMLGVVV